MTQNDLKGTRAVTTVLLAILVFVFIFAPFINYSPWAEIPSNGGLCVVFPITVQVSPSYYVFHFGTAYVVGSYEFLTSAPNCH